ncbi:MAG TPA: NAD(P)/FAD-dependent oxidoreductase [Thermoanaerobaculia bacterium]|nr:NAD(P)/FAD-dependent oxidoreductase [Thermoanaerobaculia bacterium]
MIDLLVVGAGPAGLATAIHARRAGLTVRVVDRRPGPPVDKACGEGLMPDGVAALAALGVVPATLGGRPFRGIRYVDGDVVAEAGFPAGSGRGNAGFRDPGSGDAGPGDGGPAAVGLRGAGLGLRRVRLHQALVSAAQAVGVEIEWSVVVDGLERRPGRDPGGILEDRGSLGHAEPRFEALAAGRVLPARWLVFADGLLSRGRRLAGLAARPVRHRRFGVRRHYAVPTAAVPDVVEVWWGERCEAYVTPTGAGEVGIAMLWAGRTATFDHLLAGFPRLAERLADAEIVSRDRGAGPLRQRVRGVVRGNLALVGDAAGYVDAITGEGLSLAFHQAAALAAAVAAGDLAHYAADHRRLGRLPDTMTRLLLALERRPPLRRRALRALAADPVLFSRLLAIHTRALPPRALGWQGAARLALSLARG